MFLKDEDMKWSSSGIIGEEEIKRILFASPTYPKASHGTFSSKDSRRARDARIKYSVEMVKVPHPSK
jgi:hypothetical protein